MLTPGRGTESLSSHHYHRQPLKAAVFFCLLSLATKIGNELEKDKKVVAFEIQGIVDNNPYKGLSPELKQEGLASFRAWNAIREINKKIPNATAFEGPSLQLKDKRGYRIKAYFVE